MSIKTTVMAGAIGTASMVTAALGQDAPSVVLVHGAWADGSSWAEVIPLLQQRGLHVVAVHNPASSFEAGNSEKVAALVYVAAFAPAVGQSVNAIVGAAPAPPPWQGEIPCRFAGLADVVGR